MRQLITRTIRGFEVAIAHVLAFVGIFSLYADTLSAEQQDEVLIKAIPFVGIFVSILLAFICFIVVLAIMLNGKVPPRTYRPMEYLIIAGILLGVLGLFQGWKLFAYEYGFLLLLFSVLSLIVWSHVTPMPSREAQRLSPFRQNAWLIGLAAGALVWIGLAVYISVSIEPEEPYGIRPRVWEMIMDEVERQQMRDDNDTEYTTNRIPMAVFISLLPGGIVFFAVREAAQTVLTKQSDAPSAVHQPAEGAQASSS